MKKFAVLLVLLVLANGACSGDLTKNAQQLEQQIKQQVVDDAIKQYEIVVFNGDKMDIYVHAQLVTVAYLNAGDEDNYRKWKIIEKRQGINAGMPLEMLGLD